jgi:hypothetical protein
MEARVLSVAAGALGILVGSAAAVLIPRTLHGPTLISTGSIGIPSIFSYAVGIFFGFYPTLRASRLDPIEALRSEQKALRPGDRVGSMQREPALKREGRLGGPRPQRADLVDPLFPMGVGHSFDHAKVRRSDS